MNYRARQVFNSINNILLVAFLLSNLIKNDTIVWIINLSFLVSMIIESIIHLNNRKLIKQGDLVYINGLMTPLFGKLQKIFLVLSLGAAVYHGFYGDFNSSLLSSSMNVLFPIFFALFIKDIMAIKVNSESIEFFGMINSILLWKDIQEIRFEKNTFKVKTHKKTYPIKNVCGNNFVELQEFLLNNKLNHIKLSY